jgi:hypothetical protein
MTVQSFFQYGKLDGCLVMRFGDNQSRYSIPAINHWYKLYVAATIVAGTWQWHAASLMRLLALARKLVTIKKGSML